MSQNFEARIRDTILALFPQFDLNRSDTLDVNELGPFFNATFKALGYNLNLGQQQAYQAMAKIDRTNDRCANREELFYAIRDILMPGGQQIAPDFQAPPLGQGQQQW